MGAGIGLWASERRRRGGDLPRRSSVFVKNPEATTSHDSGELILSLPRQREGLALNPVAARCWDLMDGCNSLRAIGALIAAEYQVSRATALDEVLRFAGRLRRGYY